MSRVEQINTLLKRIISEAIVEHVQLPETLLTVTYVDMSPDLKNAKVGVSFLPKNLTGSGLAELKKSTSFIAREINRKSELRVTPKLRWEVDETEERLAGYDKLYAQIEDERNAS